MLEINEDMILQDAIKKHNMNFQNCDIDMLKSLIRYSRNIGYNEGYIDYSKEDNDNIKLGHLRYEKIRKLNIKEFQDLYKTNLKGEKSFDSLVDELK